VIDLRPYHADDVDVSQPPPKPPVSADPDVRLLTAAPWSELFAAWWRVADRHPVGDPMRQCCYDVVVGRVHQAMLRHSQRIYGNRYRTAHGEVPRTVQVPPPYSRDAAVGGWAAGRLPAPTPPSGGASPAAPADATPLPDHVASAPQAGLEMDAEPA
jgi:hypothetical protein